MTTEPDPCPPADPGPDVHVARSGPPTVGGAVGVPYHRMDAWVPRRWWRLAIPLVVFVMVQVVMSAAAGLGSLLPARGVAVLGRHTQLAVLFAGIGACLPLLAVWMRRTRRPFSTLSSVAGRLRLRWLACCLAVAVTPYLALGVVVVVLPGQERAGWSTFAATVAVLLPLVVFAVAAEEYVCRGFVLQGVGSLFVSPWPGIAAQAALFAALHGSGTVWGMLDVLCYGAALGWLTVRTGGLEAALALHLGQNLMAALIDVALIPAQVSQAATDQTMADAPWQAALAHLAITGVFVVLLDALAVWGRVARHTTNTNTNTATSGVTGPVPA